MSSLDVTFPANSTLFLGSPQGMKRIHGVGKHQLLIADFDIPADTRAKNIPEITPVVVTWGDPPVYNTFYGYVNHQEVIWEDGANLLRLYLLGTSLFMNSARPSSSWRNVTHSYIASQVALRQGLRAVVHKSKVLLPYWTQGSESDFAMMNRLAEDAGYRFWVDGSSLYFLDPTELSTSSVAEFTKDNLPSVDTLLDIHLTSGSLAPGAVTDALAYGLSADGRVVQASSRKTATEIGMTPGNTTVIKQGAAHAYADALRLTDAHLARGIWSTAKARVVGASNVRLGDLVTLSGSALHYDYTGDWQVVGITNALQRKTFGNTYDSSTELELARNQFSGNQFRTTTQSTGVRTEVEAVLRSNERWESATLETVYV